MLLLGHRQYLPPGHSWRAHMVYDNVLSIEPCSPPVVKTGEEILLGEVNSDPFRKPGKHPNNWDRKRKRSTYFEYWIRRIFFFLIGVLVQIEGQT